MSQFHTPYINDTTNFDADTMNAPLAALDKAIGYHHNVIVHTDGDISYVASTGVLAWTGIIRIVFIASDGKAIENTIAIGNDTISDGEYIYVDLIETDGSVLTTATAVLTTDVTATHSGVARLVLGYRNATNKKFYSNYIQQENFVATEIMAANGTGLGLYDDGGNGIFVEDGGQVGIGTGTPEKDLDVNGEIRASTGILFGTDTAAANTLDDYEEGTFTPTILFGGASTGIIYATQVGRYTKIGNRIHLNLKVELSDKGTATGNLTIDGFPFTSADVADANTVGSLCLNNLSGLNGAIAGHMLPNTAEVIAYYLSAGTLSNMTDSNVTDTSAFTLGITYEV